MVDSPRLANWLTALVMAALGMAALAPGQAAAGEVRGFDDRPVSGAVVRGFGVGGDRLGEVLSDPHGRFELVAAQAISSLEIQLEGVVIQLPIANGGDQSVRTSFVHSQYFTLRGHVVDPGGVPVAAADLMCRDPYGKAIAVVTTDARGAFVVRSDRPVTDLLLDPLGWRHVQPGPFMQDRGIAVDLRLMRDSYFALRGRVLDDDGNAAAGVRVEGRTGPARVAGTTSDDDGRFVLWANREVGELLARKSLPLAQRPGPWQAAAEVELDARVFGMVLVTGRFVDKDGAGLAHSMLFAVDKKVPPGKGVPAVGATDAQGNFRLMVPRNTPFLFAFCDGGDHRAFAQLPANGESLELRSNQ